MDTMTQEQFHTLCQWMQHAINIGQQGTDGDYSNVGLAVEALEEMGIIKG